jgi:hypothetical protein
VLLLSMQELGVDMERSTVELMHEEIKRRAYQLIERKQAVADGNHVEDELKGELPRIVYALSRLQECANADVGYDRIHRAARIYLLALSSFAMERRRQTGASASVRDGAKM